MQNISESYLLEIKKPSRSFECRITIGDNIYTDVYKRQLLHLHQVLD